MKKKKKNKKEIASNDDFLVFIVVQNKILQVICHNQVFFPFRPSFMGM
jgi:hypothetical protein